MEPLRACPVLHTTPTLSATTMAPTTATGNACARPDTQARLLQMGSSSVQVDFCFLLNARGGGQSFNVSRLQRARGQRSVLLRVQHLAAHAAFLWLATTMAPTAPTPTACVPLDITAFLLQELLPDKSAAKVCASVCLWMRGLPVF